MALRRLSLARKKTVGTKQTIKAIERGLAKVVFIAQNADRHVVEPIIQSCREKAILVISVDSMQSLGKACGIDVGCAAAAVTEE